MDDVPLAGRTLLPFNQPFFEASFVKNVVANRYFEQFLAVFEVAMAHAALLLKGHEPLALRDCAWVGVVLEGLVSYRLDCAHVNPDHAVDIVGVLVLLVES